MKEKIEINGKKYLIDIKEAKRLNLLEEEKPKVQARIGGIYDYCGTILFCVKVFHDDESSYQLIGLFGCCEPYSDTFFEKLHTLNELSEYLSKEKYKYIKQLPLLDKIK
jgi:hypothetical protein